MSRLVVVTGTSTDVGKTIATAAVVAAAEGTVVAIKPVQSGANDDGVGDAETVRRLTGCDVREFVTLDEPLAPDMAARIQGVTIPTVSDHVAPILALCDQYDTVVVEGAGGVLVRLDSEGGTILDLASLLSAVADVEVIIVCSAGLGTLNHTELTAGAVRARGLEPAGLIVGSWPTEPGLAERLNIDELPKVSNLPLLATLPAGAGRLTTDQFVAAAPGWFA
ncbi:MAG: dethiobiotin synthase [Aeromicrobium sp.]